MKKKKSIVKGKNSKSILDRVKPVSTLPPIVTAVFYGRAGTGKTTLCASFPPPILFMDIKERGTDSVADVKGAESIFIEEWSDIEEMYWELKNGNTDFKTVVIDAAHSWQDLAIDQAKILNKKNLDDQTSKRDFGTASGLMKTWIYNYRDLADLGINVVFLAHDRISDQEEEGDHDEIMPEVGPRLMPSVAGMMMGAVKIVGNTFIKTRKEKLKRKRPGQKDKRIVEYCLRLGPNEFYYTKIRSPKSQPIPDYIVDPDYKDLIALMKGSNTSKSQTVRRKKNG